MVAERQQDESEPDEPAIRNEHTGPTENLVQARTILGNVNFFAARSELPVPQQLPAAPAAFVGRDRELATLTSSLNSEVGPTRTVAISAISGAGGIGKTWLALTWAHRNLDCFPDGQLSVDLRGFSSGDPKHPADVLADFLAALGVDHDKQPTDLDARSALYRTHTTGKQLLILLDNAATADQVEPRCRAEPRAPSWSPAVVNSFAWSPAMALATSSWTSSPTTRHKRC